MVNTIGELELQAPVKRFMKVLPVPAATLKQIQSNWVWFTTITTSTSTINISKVQWSLSHYNLLLGQETLLSKS